jgi:micrococcal nuclease
LTVVLRWFLVAVAALAVLVPVVLDRLPGDDDLGRGGVSRTGEWVRVDRVVDGDTIVVDRGGKRERVRYIGVDTPETKRPGTPVQCYGPEATAANRRLVEGRDVRLVLGEEPRDHYQRLLGYVYRGEDELVNATLVRDGYARTLTIAPNDRFAPRLESLQREAQDAGRGLWGACP